LVAVKPASPRKQTPLIFLKFAGGRPISSSDDPPLVAGAFAGRTLGLSDKGTTESFVSLRADGFQLCLFCYPQSPVALVNIERKTVAK
jgi:hypothetical protein